MRVNRRGIIFIDGKMPYDIFIAQWSGLGDQKIFRATDHWPQITIYPAPSSSLVRTSASQAENTGSNPVGAIFFKSYQVRTYGISSVYPLVDEVKIK